MINIAQYNWNQTIKASSKKLTDLGLPEPKPRQSARTYFRELSKSGIEDWLVKAKQITGQTEKQILAQIKSKRKPSPKPPAPKLAERVEPQLKLNELIEAMTTPEEAQEFVKSSSELGVRFMKHVIDARKAKRPKR